MVIELFLVLGVLGIILVCFYRQAVQEFRILQTEGLDKAMPLLHERCPTVVLPAPAPKDLWTRADVSQRPTLAAFALNGQPLSQRLTQDSVQLRPSTTEQLAEAIGFPVWVNKTILPIFQESVWWGPLLTTKTEALVGAQGLRPTYAYSTVLMATEGALAVSLVNESSESYLPKKWLGKRLSKMTRDDAPLLHQIQYVDVIVRPGSALLIPPHWKVCWENHESPSPSMSVWIEVHHPLSQFVKAAAQRRLGA